MANIVQNRRGTTDAWLDQDPVIYDGELVIEELKDGTIRCKIGNGSSKFSELPYVDAALQEQLTELSNRHEKDQLDVTSTIDTKFTELSNTIKQRETILNAAINDSKTAATKYVNEQINTAKTEVSEQLTTQFKATTDEIAGTVSTLTDTVNTNSQENSTAHEQLNTNLTAALNALATELRGKDSEINTAAKELTTRVDTAETKLTSLESDNNALSDKIYSVRNNIANELETLRVSLSSSVSESNFTSVELSRKLSNLEATQVTYNEAIMSFLLEYVTRTYTELADLAGDDKMIVDKFFSVYNRLSKIVDTFTQDVYDLDAAVANVIVQFEQTQTNVKNLIETAKDILGSGVDDISALDTSVRNSISTFEKRLEGAETNFKDLAADVRAEAAVANERISNLMTAEEGSTTLDRELLDIRVAYDQVTYDSAGDAVRAVGKELQNLKDSLPDYIPSNSVDGLQYEGNQLYLTSKGEPVGDPVTITGGGGGSGSASTVLVKNELDTNNFVIAAGRDMELAFRYTSELNSAPTDGTGTYDVIINSKTIKDLSGTVINGALTKVDVTKYLNTGDNTIRIRCEDPYGSVGSYTYKIKVISIALEHDTKFDSAKIYEDELRFSCVVRGNVDKYLHIILDDNTTNKIKVYGDDGLFLNASRDGFINTSVINDLISPAVLAHGTHTITAYLTTTVVSNGIDEEVQSNVLFYEVIYAGDSDEALLASTFNTEKPVTQKDMLSIPYIVYDKLNYNPTVTLSVYAVSDVTGVRNPVPYSTTTATVVSGIQSIWSISDYPLGLCEFEIKYSYERKGYPTEITRVHKIQVNALSVGDMTDAETSRLLLFLSSADRTNDTTDDIRNTWTFKQETAVGGATIESEFSGFNWKANGWVVNEATKDVCLRLTGPSQVKIPFNPFAKDACTTGLTMEFEFEVKNINDRRATIIDCTFDAFNAGTNTTSTYGFKATPDMASFSSRTSFVSCRYKEDERLRVSVVLEPKQGDRFISIYLDGILSGIKRYSDQDSIQYTGDDFYITLGSDLCSLDVYKIRMYDTALSTKQILRNFIADRTSNESKLELYKVNEIYGPDYTGDNQDDLSYEKALALGTLPIITFTGELPKEKGDKREDVHLHFIDPTEGGTPEVSVVMKSLDVQGTSSAAYPRKNWKIKLKDAIQHMPNAVPAKVFCIKVDYAEATGTHNTGVANFVDSLYSTASDIPIRRNPQETAEAKNIYTAVKGRPCLLFTRATEEDAPQFYAKANFNYDKGAEEVFGFTKENYIKYGVECWEFCNNKNKLPNFAEELVDNYDWSEDFEPRYVPSGAEYEYYWDEIEDLIKKRNTKEAVGETLSSSEQANLTRYQNSCIRNFKTMFNWVVSTAVHTVDADNKIVPLDITAEERTARLEKFKNEFTQYFDMHFCLVYYVFTYVALMADQRAKNMFLTYWRDIDSNGNVLTTGKWYPYFYDNDTIFGINNEGALVFDYYHDDADEYTDPTTGKIRTVYSAQNSILWQNFKECFPTEIAELYKTIRQGKLTEDKIIEYFITKGSDKWSATMYNEDAESKYVGRARGTAKDEYLYQVRGNGEQHLRYFLSNRIRFCDSRWNAGNNKNFSDDKSNFVLLRIYTDSADAKIKLTPFSTTTLRVEYGTGTVKVVPQEVNANCEAVFEPRDSEGSFYLNNLDTVIYPANELSSLGDLSGLRCGFVNVSDANRLVKLQLGKADSNYSNPNLRQVYVGANQLLQEVDLRNCTGLGKSFISSDDNSGEPTEPMRSLDLAQCPNITSVYTTGTCLSAIALPAGGHLTTLHLPATITEVNLDTQPRITYTEVDGVPSTSNGLFIEAETVSDDVIRPGIGTINIKNCPGIDTYALYKKYETEVNNLTLVGINWQLADATDLMTMISRKNAETLKPASDGQILVGSCYIGALTGAQYKAIKEAFPSLTISFGSLSSIVTFMSSHDDDAVQLADPVTINGLDSQLGEISVEYAESMKQIIEASYTPEATQEFTYKFAGWSKVRNDKTVYQNALTGIAGDLVLYPVFDEIRNTYTATFKLTADATEPLVEVQVPYGSKPRYPDDAPPLVYEGSTASASLYEFLRWEPTINEPMYDNCTFVAQFGLKDDTWAWYYSSNGLGVYTVDKQTNTATMTERVYSNPAVAVPAFVTENGGKPSESDTKYPVTDISSPVNNKFWLNDSVVCLLRLPYTLRNISANMFCYSATNLESVFFDDLERAQLQFIAPSSFHKCSNLRNVELPSTLKDIGSSAFADCPNLTSLLLPQSLETIGQAAFEGSTNLVISVSPDNTKFSMENSCLVQKNADAEYTLVYANPEATGDQLLVEYPVVPLSELAAGCFSKHNNIISAIIPEGVKLLGDRAFHYCDNLSEVRLPSTLTKIGNSCFYETAITSIEIPASVEEIGTYAFAYTPLVSVEIPDGTKIIRTYAFGQCKNLESVHISKSVDTIDLNAFTESTKLSSITVDADSEYFCAEENVLYNKGKTHLMQYASKADTRNFTLPDTLKDIDKYAFYRADVDTVTFTNVPKVAVGGSSPEGISDYAFTLANADRGNKPIAFTVPWQEAEHSKYFVTSPIWGAPAGSTIKFSDKEEEVRY